MDIRSTHVAGTWAALSGLAYWAAVSVWSHGGEPWDAPMFWTVFYPGALLLAAVLGWAFPLRAWLWGAVVLLAQVPVVMLVSGMEPLLVAGLLYALVLSIPAMLVSWLAGRARRRAGR